MNFVTLGTPQPQDLTALSATDRNKHLPVHLQDVRDDQGRQRLHGAFQGGFSAGYYNTVGSKEGWAPVQFKSSRSERKEHVASKPQDFMDQEDVLEFGASVKATNDYIIMGDSDRRIAKINLSDRANGYFSSFTSSSANSIDEPIGFKLLRKLGWVGSEKSANEQHQVSKAKSDTFGLGFDPFIKNPELEHTSLRPDPEAFTRIEKNRKQGGFGVGVFEIEEDGDDVYDYSLKSNYDTTLGGSESVKSNQSTAKPARLSIPLLTRNGSTAGNLTGFVLCKNAAIFKQFVAPMPPAGYVPKCPDSDKNNTSKTSNTATPLLTTLPIIMAPVSTVTVFAKKDDLKGLDNKIEVKAMPTIPTDVALAALKGFMPFSDNLAKQSRYKKYLEKMANQNTEIFVDKSLTVDEQAHEGLEFSKAALIFRPLSNMMSSRFTSEISLKPVVKVKAVKFGKDTRSYSTWNPDRITCKRFGVAYTKDETDDIEEKPENEVVNQEVMDQLMNERDRIINQENQGAGMIEEDDRNLIEERGQEAVKLTERPSMDLFLAIFADSDDESDIKNDTFKNISGPVFKTSKPAASPYIKVAQVIKKRNVNLACIGDEDTDGYSVVIKKKISKITS